jgi:hypothetical protein
MWGNESSWSKSIIIVGGHFISPMMEPAREELEAATKLPLSIPICPYKM